MQYENESCVERDNAAYVLVNKYDYYTESLYKGLPVVLTFIRVDGMECCQYQDDHNFIEIKTFPLTFKR